jgi:hypothetical protein
MRIKAVNKKIQMLAAALVLGVSSIAVAGPSGLLGVQIGYPQTNVTSNAGDGATYDGTNYVIKSSPIFTTFTATGTAAFMAGTPSMTITAPITAAGVLQAGSSFVMTGTVTDPDTNITYSGTLLSGIVLDYGIIDIAPTGGTDFSDFRLQATGGTMLPLYGGADIGVIMFLEGSTYAGSFGSTFGAVRAKGDIGPIPGGGGGVGTGTIGYWKNHPEAWPVGSLTLGGVPYSKDAAIAILDTPTRGSKAIAMAKQLIAAMLNVANGTDSSCIADTITAADTWLTNNGGVTGGQRSWNGGDIYHDDLDSYNNGEMCAPPRN